MSPIVLGLIVAGYVAAIWQFGWWGVGAAVLSIGGMLLAIRRP